MNKRAKDVADRFKSRQSVLRSFRGGRSSFFGPKGLSFPHWETIPLSALSIRGRLSICYCQSICPPLNPSDCMVGVPVNTVPVKKKKTSGRLSLYVAQWQNITRDHFIISDFSSRHFPGGVMGSHRTPQGSKSSPSYLQRNPRVDLKKKKKCYRPNGRFSVTLPFSYFCDS